MKKLSKQELTQFNEFLLKQIYLTNRRMIVPLYRGDKLKNLHEKLGVYYYETEPNYQELLSRLFMVGEKSRNFYSNEFFKTSTDRIIKIDDCGEIVFNYIFDNLNSSLKSKNSHTIKFFDNNELFKKFFLKKKNNKKIFSSSVLSANQNEQIFFKNYYLSLLHQLGTINYKDRSHFVSTSTEYTVAQNFSGSNSSNKRIILHAWRATNNMTNRFEKYNIPKYKRVPYEYQKEVSILAGILPHYIIGLQILEDKKFYINPNIFTNTISDNLFIEGLKINQENFEAIFKQTNYGKSFEVRGDQIMER